MVGNVKIPFLTCVIISSVIDINLLATPCPTHMYLSAFYLSLMSWAILIFSPNLLAKKLKISRL